MLGCLDSGSDYFGFDNLCVLSIRNAISSHCS